VSSRSEIEAKKKAISQPHIASMFYPIPEIGRGDTGNR
jgi:hypothetical protein